MFTFVTGGLRSGKSAYAMRRASEMGPPPWLYVAARLDGDEELRQRVSRSRRDQDAIWTIVEAPAQLAGAIDANPGHGAAVIDGFTVWLSGRLAVSTAEGLDRELLGEVEVLADRLYRSTTQVVVVTTEVGLGLMPQGLADRGFLDIAGLSNQILAERASSVVLMVSGIPLRLR